MTTGAGLANRHHQCGILLIVSMAMESQVTVSRTSPQDIKDRQVVVKLDGQIFAKLSFGKTATRPVAPGRHTLLVDNTFHKKTLEFELAAGEHASFRTINRAPGCTYVLVAFFGAGPMFVSIERESPE